MMLKNKAFLRFFMFLYNISGGQKVGGSNPLAPIRLKPLKILDKTLVFKGFFMS